MQTKSCTWLLLLYALPSKPTSARVNLWRKLKRFGALPLKTSAYILPDNSTQYERLQWLSEEIRAAGGDASLVRVMQVEGIDNQGIVQMFNSARKSDYHELVRVCRQRINGSRKKGRATLATEFQKLEKRFNEINEIDYFKCPSAEDARIALEGLAKTLTLGKKMTRSRRLSLKNFNAKVWLTRPRPGIDRAGSAWLIRKFIDQHARFVFTSDLAAHPKAIPFDIAGAEFSHHGEDCTFETLVKRFALEDRAVLEIAEMVHDADLEDEKFQRCECLGINSVLIGWERAGVPDAELLSKGMACFEGLYRSLNV